MRTFNRHILILMSIVLITSCIGQNPPVNLTNTVNPTSPVSLTPTSSESFPLMATPSMTEISSTLTPSPEQNPMSTPIFTLDVSSSSTQTGNTNAPLIIPVSGALPTSTKSEKTNKFQNFTIPVSDESGFSLLPVTGFPPRVISRVEMNTPSFAHLITPVLEIPSLELNIPILGIPFSNGMWDVSWLWDQAGWLEGTAYPTINGNSVLTAHVVTADGKNGPFAHLKSLTSDDYVFIINSGFRYVYRVDSMNFVKPNDGSVFSHEDDSWLTLITCDSYDEKTKEYLLRVVVRAQLVEVQEIK